MTIRKGVLGAAWLAGSALGASVAIQPASAQDAAAPTGAETRESAQYDLPAQSLADTLRAIARIAGREIAFAAEVVEGRRAPPVRGRLTFDEAVAAALAKSGLVFEYEAGALLVREPFAAGTADSAEQAMTVTGTRIRGAGSASPAIVSTRRRLEESGVTDLAGFTRILPQNYTGGQNPGVAGGGQQGGQSNINNSATLNLRGLGPDATLTLINGHRIAYDAVTQGVDISAIPLGAIERVEVIADGASALYGSDAVGGVANIILRRDFEGLELTARLGSSTEGGNDQQQYSAVAGTRWSSGGFMAAADYSEATPIFADQREYTSALDPSLTLTLRNKQLSGVLAGHQQLASGVVLEFDGYVMERRSRKQSPFLPDTDVETLGLVTRPELRSYAIAPTLRLELPAGWQGSLGATRAVSRTALDSRIHLGGVVTPSRLVYENRMSAFEAGAEGALFGVPGGEARLALGAGYRSLVLDANATQTVAGNSLTILDFVESRNVLFGYGELSLPLVGPDSQMSMVERLILSVALRYERYEDIDEVATPKVGLTYEPHRDVTFRATWGQSFKAPTLFQVNQGLQGALLPAVIFDPQPTPPLPAGSGVIVVAGGRPDLRSERATTWLAGLELRPVDGLRLAADYFRIDYRNRIGSPLSGTLSALANPIFRDLITFNPSADEVNALIATFPQGLSNQTGAPFNPANVGAIIDGALRNTARVHVEGIDLLSEHRIDLGASRRLLLTAAASYLESDQQLAPGQPSIEQAGTIFHPPHWRARAGASWESSLGGVSAYLSYVGGTKDNRFADTEGPGPFVTLDLTARLRTGDAGPFGRMEFSLAALNLLNEEPDVIRNSDPASPSYDSTNQSPAGRFIGLSVRKSW